LPAELIKQYKDALSKASEDLRLVVLLSFNAFEEVMRALVAWRLSCDAKDLPGPLKNSPSLLFDIVLAGGGDAKALRANTRLLSEARNAVAHGFHKRDYRVKIAAFVRSVSGKAWPSARRREGEEFVKAVAKLALAIAEYHVDYVDDRRGDFPVPLLTYELEGLANTTK
jgi:hypothetical protein